MDGAAVCAARVAPARSHRQILHAVAVKVSYSGHRRAEAVAKGHRRHVGCRRIELCRAFDGAVRVEEHQVRRAQAAVARGARRQVRHAVAVKVADSGHRRAEAVAYTERRPVGHRAVYLEGALYAAVRAEEQQVDGAGLVQIAPGPHGQVCHAVAVQIPNLCHRRAEHVAAPDSGRVDRAPFYGARLCRSVRVEEHQIDGARVSCAGVVARGPHGQVCHAVAVQVPYSGHRRAEHVAGRQGHVGPALAQPDCPAYRRAGVHEQHVRVAAGPRELRPHGQVARAVAVQVPQARHRRSELVDGARRRNPACRAPDVPRAFQGAGRVEHQQVERARVVGSPVVGRGAHGDVCHAVAVQVAGGGHRRSEFGADRQAGAAGRLRAYLGIGLCRAVRVHQEHVDGAVGLRPRGAGQPDRIAHGPHGQVARAVAVQVADRGHRRSEKVKDGGQSGRHPRRVLYRPVRVHEEHVDGAAPRGPHGQVAHSVAVQVPNARGRIAEPVVVGQGRAARRPVVYLHGALCRPVRVEQHEVQCPPRGAGGASRRGRHGRVRPVRPHCHVRYPVAVQVPRRCHRRAEIVHVRQGRPAARPARDLCYLVARAVRVH